MEREVGLERREPRRHVADLVLERVDLRRQAADLRAEARLLRLRARDLRVQLRRASRRPTAFWSPGLSPASAGAANAHTSASRSRARFAIAREVRRRLRTSLRSVCPGLPSRRHESRSPGPGAAPCGSARPPRPAPRRARPAAAVSRASSSVESRARGRLGGRVARVGGRAELVQRGAAARTRAGAARSGSAAPRPPRPGARAACSHDERARSRASTDARVSSSRAACAPPRGTQRGGARPTPSRMSPYGQ